MKANRPSVTLSLAALLTALMAADVRADETSTATASDTASSSTGAGLDGLDAREAEIFGGAESTGTSPALPGEVEGAPDREAELFGEDASGGREASVFGDDSSRERMESRLETSDDILDIGGQLWLRFEYGILEEGSVKRFPLRSPSFVDLYADARPNERVRAFVQGRLRHDFTVGEDSTGPLLNPLEQTSVQLDQLWLKFDVWRRIFLTVGRQRIRWGAGRFWNPTDFLNQQALDPLDVLDQRLGVSLVKLHVPFEDLGWNLYAVANIDEADPLERIGGALRAEVVFGQTEISVSAAVRKDDPIRLGADISTGVWIFDLRAEAAALRRVRTPFFRGDLDFATFTLPESYSRRDEWIPQAVLGADAQIAVSDEDSITLGVEYFFNDAGYRGAELYPWLIAQGAYRPLYVGRHYGAFYAMMVGPGRFDDTTLLFSALGNLSDRSFVWRFDYRVTVLTYLGLSAWISQHFGRVGELKLGIEVPPIPLVPELENGFSVAPPVLDLGLALSLRI